MLAVLILTFTILGFSALAVVKPFGTAGISNPGPHGLSQILYAYVSSTGNNGSAFAGINANTMWYNTSTAVAQLPRSLLHDHSDHGHRRQPSPLRKRCPSPRERSPSRVHCFPLCWFPQFNRRSAHVFPCTEPRANPRALADDERKGILKTYGRIRSRQTKAAR